MAEEKHNSFSTCLQTELNDLLFALVSYRRHMLFFYTPLGMCEQILLRVSRFNY